MSRRTQAFMASRNSSLRKARAAKGFPMPEPTVLDPLPPNTQPIIRHGREAITYHIPVSPSIDQQTLKTTISLPCHSTWTSGLHFHTRHTEYLRLLRGSIFVYLDGVVSVYSAQAGGEEDIRGSENLVEGLIVEVPRYARHNWGRAKEYLDAHRSSGRRPRPKNRVEDLKEEVLVEEWTEPSDLTKPLFFWNLNGVITAPADGRLSARKRIGRMVLGTWWVPFQLLVIFWELDNWPVFVSMRNALVCYGPFWLRRYKMPDWPLRVASRLERWIEYIITLVVHVAARLLGLVLGVTAVEGERTPVNLWEACQKTA